MSGHVFVSYSHQSDSGYVAELATYLGRFGIDVWYDKEIVHGDRWTTTIRDKVDTCVAFVVIMTPEAERSDWVDIEIARARSMKRAILPLLLRGERFFTLANIQDHDVRGGQLPGSSFIGRLRALIFAQTTFGEGGVAAQSLIDRHEMACRSSEVGDQAQGIRILREVIADQIRLLGADHIDVLTSRHNLAHSIGLAGDHATAILLVRELVADDTRVLGPDHPRTLTSRHELACLIGEGGDREEAVRLLREVVADQIIALGDDHPQVLMSRHNLAYNLGEAGRHLEAATLAGEVAADRGRVLGPGNIHTLTSRHNHAVKLFRSGAKREATALLASLVADLTRVLGSDHRQTTMSKHQLLLMTTDAHAT